MRKILATVLVMVLFSGFAVGQLSAKTLKEERQELNSKKAELNKQVKTYEKFIFHYRNDSLKPEWYKKYSVSEQREIVDKAFREKDNLLDEIADIDARLADFRAFDEFKMETYENRRKANEDAKCIREYLKAERFVKSVKSNPMNWRENNYLNYWTSANLGRSWFNIDVNPNTFIPFGLKGNIFVLLGE